MESDAEGRIIPLPCYFVQPPGMPTGLLFLVSECTPGVKFLPLFTDQDSAVTFLERSPLAGHTLLEVRTPAGLMALLTKPVMRDVPGAARVMVAFDLLSVDQPNIISMHPSQILAGIR